MQPIRVLELRSVRGTGGGPEKTILLSAAAAPEEFAITVCYVRDARDDVFALDQRARDLGVDYVEVIERNSFDRTIWPALRELVRARQIDIVHSHEHKTDLLAYLLGRSDRIVPLATAHGWVGQSWKERLYYQGDKRLLARFPRVIAVSEQIRQTLLGHGAQPERVTTVLNSIDPQAHRRDRGVEAAARAELVAAPGDVVIGAVGRLERQKRFDVLIDAFDALRARWTGRPLQLRIAGAGSLERSLQSQVDALKLNDVCRLIGHCSNVIRFHHALDLFVQSSEYEGTPNAVLEAMALETPIVATDAGGTAEVCRDGVDGQIVPFNDIAVLAASMASVLDDVNRSRERVASARRRVEHELSFDARRRRVEQIYEEIADRREAAVS